MERRSGTVRSARAVPFGASINDLGPDGCGQLSLWKDPGGAGYGRLHRAFRRMRIGKGVQLRDHPHVQRLRVSW